MVQRHGYAPVSHGSDSGIGQSTALHTESQPSHKTSLIPHPSCTFFSRIVRLCHHHNPDCPRLLLQCEHYIVVSATFQELQGVV